MPGPRSEANIIPNWQTTPWKEPSGNGSTDRSASRHSIPDAGGAARVADHLLTQIGRHELPVRNGELPAGVASWHRCHRRSPPPVLDNNVHASEPGPQTRKAGKAKGRGVGRRSRMPGTGRSHLSRRWPSSQIDVPGECLEKPCTMRGLRLPPCARPCVLSVLALNENGWSAEGSGGLHQSCRTEPDL